MYNGVRVGMRVGVRVGDRFGMWKKVRVRVSTESQVWVSGCFVARVWVCVRFGAGAKVCPTAATV